MIRVIGAIRGCIYPRPRGGSVDPVRSSCLSRLSRRSVLFCGGLFGAGGGTADNPVGYGDGHVEMVQAAVKRD